MDFYLRNAGLRTVRVVGVGATSLRKRTKYLFLHVVYISHPKFSSRWDPCCFTRLFYFSSINFLQGGILCYISIVLSIPQVFEQSLFLFYTILSMPRRSLNKVCSYYFLKKAL